MRRSYRFLSEIPNTILALRGGSFWSHRYNIEQYLSEQYIKIIESLTVSDCFLLKKELGMFIRDIIGLDVFLFNDSSTFPIVILLPMSYEFMRSLICSLKVLRSSASFTTFDFSVSSLA